MAIGSVYRPFLEVARDAGVDVAHELARFGIREEELSEARLAPHQGRALVLRLAAQCGTPELGLLAATRARLLDLDLMGYLARHSEHAFGALESLVRYPQLLGDTAACELVRGGGEVSLRFGLSGGRRMLPDGADFAVAVLWRVLLELSAGAAQPIEVQLARPRPRRPSVYRAYFGVLPEFDAETNVLRYREGALLAPLAEHDPRLQSILMERAAASIASLPIAADDWLNQVRAELSRSLERGRLEIASIAAHFAMSERTLRRRLDAAGTSFRALSDDVRRQRALQLIDEGETCVAALAQASGYDDPTAFARAFRRWTGLAPQRYLSDRRPGDYPQRNPAPFGGYCAPHTPSSTAYTPPAASGTESL